MYGFKSWFILSTLFFSIQCHIRNSLYFHSKSIEWSPQLPQKALQTILSGLVFVLFHQINQYPNKPQRKIDVTNFQVCPHFDYKLYKLQSSLLLQINKLLRF